MAAKMEIGWKEVAEEIVSIRRATEQEKKQFIKVLDYYKNLMPSAISSKQAEAL